MQYPSADENSTSDSLPTRRDAIKVLSAVAASALTGGGLAVGARNDDIPADATHFFTPDEARLVEAVSDQIIPADKDPGAKDARVVLFIDRQLVGPYAQLQAAYRDGLRALQETCRRQFGKPFEALGWDDQTKVLAALEAGRAPKELWKSPTCTEFFNLVLEHTKQGFYGGPQNGGNYNYVSYQMLGLDHDYYPLPIRNSGGKP
ncbi:MAG: gluconate 2-dehydrogenase subunit 3 family protein [Thermoguttaceae bacterium]|jgi:gluconate 2-dehydrogenase gamma chain